MKCQAATLRGVGKDWEIQKITLDPPRAGEVVHNPETISPTVTGVGREPSFRAVVWPTCRARVHLAPVVAASQDGRWFGRGWHQGQ